MAKAPRPGAVKTRLGRDIGMVGAAWWYRWQLDRLIRRVGRDPRWRTVLAISPDRARFDCRPWPRRLHRIPQGRGDLGDRLTRVFRQAGPGPVVIVGGDIPGITAGQVEQAFRALGTHDAVLGPSDDGGYWAIGLRRTRSIPARFLKPVRWSTPETHADTDRAMTRFWPGIRIALIDTLNDVDTVDDLYAIKRQKPGKAIRAFPGTHP
ncbi:MAG: TIGR04282 family arsenosugar biosynthesis glycosyltransferase [Paracoccaceae bacterium]|nr:TIGR04282 family arsenosugar biosynthesis glycosyltransferase [Paracoccaceae bacterium]MDE2912251.1 TIGR04282 family arsenosugar biosynthesis glycosyltransferase [Paracoccaceae bacterium]